MFLDLAIELPNFNHVTHATDWRVLLSPFAQAHDKAKRNDQICCREHRNH